MTLNQVSRSGLWLWSWQNYLKNHHLDHSFSPLDLIWLILHPQKAFGVMCPWMMFLSQGHIKPSFLESICTLSLASSYFWLTQCSNINRTFGWSVCRDFEPNVIKAIAYLFKIQFKIINYFSLIGLILPRLNQNCLLVRDIELELKFYADWKISVLGQGENSKSS